MRIGIITAMATETLPIYRSFCEVSATSSISGVTVYEIVHGEHTLYLATSGVGEIRAALAVQMLKDLFDIDVALNFGFVGALNPRLKIGELVIASKVCHYQFDTSRIDGTKVGQYDGNNDIYFNLDADLIAKFFHCIGRPFKCVSVASGDVFVATAEQKKELSEKFGADICDMELAGIAIACMRNRLPLISVKVVSDAADGSAENDFAYAVRNGITKYEHILPALMEAITDNISTLPPSKSRY